MEKVTWNKGAEEKEGVGWRKLMRGKRQKKVGMFNVMWLIQFFSLNQYLSLCVEQTAMSNIISCFQKNSQG